MAITVKHTKVSTIPDGDDTSVVRPSDWNADHQLVGTVPVANGGTGAATLTGYVKGNGTSNMTASATVPSTDVTGLGTMSTQNSNNISVTGGSMSGVTISDYVATATKGVANGVASLDGSGTVPVSQLPAAVLGALSYQGTWNASTNTPTLTSSVGTKGYYYVVSVAGSTNLNGITDWKVGDWAVYNGSAWQKVDNTDSVTSVNGYTGTVVLTNTDISGFGTMSTQNANAVAITGGAIDGTAIGATTTSTGKFTTLNASTSLTTPIVQASNSSGLSLKNSAGTTQISMGAGGGDNASINVSTNINGVNAQIDISPTGTGHVHMKPTGTGSIEIAPTNVGTMDNMTIGATTPKAITGTTITATTFSGSGASLTNVVNSLAASTGISVSGSTGAVTVTNTAPDQTVVLTAGTGISTSGTYPNFTITNTAPASSNTYTRTSFTATASQTTFTVSYTVGLIQVYVNGVLLNGADYTATNGTSVVLAVGCNSGDIVEALVFASFSVASTVSSFSAGTTGLTPNTGTTGNVTLGGTLAIANGGTNSTATPTAGGAIYGTGTAYAVTAAGTSGQVLTSTGSSAPTWSNIPFYATDILIVAGGGAGGGTSNGAGQGGGGAGGYIAQSLVLIAGSSYTATVGGGGAGVSGGAGNSGSSSIFNAITAIGGGGGQASGNGVSGGSGSGSCGGSSATTGGSGTSGQGFAGGSASGGAPFAAGGGGGASAVGASGSGSVAGAGGAGTAWLNGTTYSGGGGGGVRTTGSGGAGGAGGGGAGATTSNTNGSNATAFTGGGGGGSSQSSGSVTGGNGAGGVIIVRYAGAQRGTGGTYSFSGGYSYHTFQTSSTYTA